MMRRSLANSNRCLPNPPPPLVATTRTRGVRVVSTGATGLASRRTPASVSNHHVAPPFPQGARRCSASAPLGVGSRRAAAIPGGECTHPQFVHGRGHAPAFGRFAHVSPSPLVARQSEFCGSRPSLSLGRCAMCGVRDCISVRPRHNISYVMLCYVMLYVMSSVPGCLPRLMFDVNRCYPKTPLSLQ